MTVPTPAPTYYVVDYERQHLGTLGVRLLHKANGHTVVYTDRHLAEASARALHKGRVYTVDSKGFTTRQGGS